MEVRLLGPLHFEQNGVAVAPTAHKPRQVLALLLLNNRRMVANSDLREELWENNPPRSAVTTLQTYILQIRKTIAGAQTEPGNAPVRDILLTTLGGYMFRAQPETIDVYRYERLAAAGRDALDNEEYAKAADLFGQAARLWQGPTLVDVPPGPLLQREIVRLEESRLNTLQLGIEANLNLYRHGEMLSGLRALCMKYRLHESLQGQFILCLHHCGRRQEALEVFRTVRAALVTELGLEPSPQLQQLHRAILAGDSALETIPSYSRFQRPIAAQRR